MQLYDMHTHILPGFDDGAKTIKDSLALLDCLKKQKVGNVCLTPHFYSNEMSVEDFVESRKEAFEKFLPFMPDNVNIVLGAEVYVTQYLFGNDDLSEITYGKSKYILTEFPYNASFTGKTMDYIENIICFHGLIPVIPHVERFPALTDNPDLIAELKDMGAIIQTNISSYTKKTTLFKRRKMLKLINEGLVDIIGSDAHSFEHNSPELFTQALDYIAEKCEKSTINRMMRKSEKIFNAALGINTD